MDAIPLKKIKNSLLQILLYGESDKVLEVMVFPIFNHVMWLTLLAIKPRFNSFQSLLDL